MDGAGSLLAANCLYNKAPSNGLTVGSWNNLMILPDGKEAEFKSNGALAVSILAHPAKLLGLNKEGL
jgi:hypothetical protein